MIYMAIFWVIVGFSVIYYLARKGSKSVTDHLIISTLLAMAFLIVAIAVKDPLFSKFGIPTEFEWIVGFFIIALSSWKLYFAPMKDMLVKTEKDVVSIKSDISSIRGDVHLIKQNLIS